VPDLHSFTTPIDHEQLQAGIKQNLKVFVAAGLPLDNPNVNIYRQSYIPAHSELTWILDCFAGMGELQRMTQFKDKSAQLGSDRISVGLFNYPVLMAADILLYGADFVPVGDDQTQHLEFTRDLAERMNAKFGDLFVVPKPVSEQHQFFGKDQGLRIKDLQDPTKKMSKSSETDKGTIFMTDDPEAAKQKIMSATTDNEAMIQTADNQPGITNLLTIYELFGGNPQDFMGQTQYGAFKQAVADKAAAFLKDFQQKLDAVDDDNIENKLRSGEEAMRDQADKILFRVQQAVGLR
jgi:tryptophanyl-tRNA synthetase